MVQSNSNPAADPLTVLLQLESSLFKTATNAEVAFLLVNQLKSLIAYDQASFWEYRSAGKLKIVQASAVSSPDPHSPYLQWLSKVVNQFRSEELSSQVVVADDLPRSLSVVWREHVQGEALWVQFKDPEKRLLGGLWITRVAPWSEQEQRVLERFTEAAAIVLSNHRVRMGWRGRVSGWLFSRVWQKVIAVAVVVALFTVPIHHSMLAPAEIVAQEPITITAPMDGVIEKMVAMPNQWIEQGEPLYILDERPLKNQLAIEKEGVEIAEAELLNASQKVFGGALGEDLDALRSKIEQSKARVAWIEQQLEQTQVAAPESGVVINAETLSWRGRPVRTGEKIITLADESRVEVEMWLPVEELQPLLESKAIDLFLYSRGNERVKAHFKRIGYQAELSPQGVLSYRITARLGDQVPSPPFRIGERGSARLYGPETRLFFYLFRKPILWLRQWLA